MPGLSGELRQRLTQSQTLAPQMRQGLELLAMSLPELRQRLHEEMSRNPCIEDIEASLEKTTVSEKVREMERDESVDESGLSEEDYEPEFGAAAAITRDEDADERRQRFFDRQTKEETLEEHLLAQLPVNCRVDACIYDCLAQLSAHRAYDSLVHLFFGHRLTPLLAYYTNIVEFSQVNLKKILILLK